MSCEWEVLLAMDEINSSFESRELGEKKHGLHGLKMLACCLIPLFFVGVLYLSGFSGDYTFYVILLMCPLMHFFMMKDHKHG